MKIHESVTLDRIVEAVRRTMFDCDCLGFCTACGEDAEGVEPDAENYRCEYCDERAVFGAEQLLLLVQE